MKSTGSTGSLLSALVLVLLALICTGNCFKQELWLYDAQGTAIQFHTRVHVADTAHFSSFLPEVTRACAKGRWYTFSNANFETYHSYLGSYGSSVVCRTFTEQATVKSLRHIGASNTDTDALSLYDGDDYSGNEILVTALAHTGITNKIRSIGITGASDWMLFEGQELDGKSRCYKLPSGYSLNWNAVSDLSLTTIGSVFKSCDAQEIKKYKSLHKSSFVNLN